ncbi:Rid family hydrolase [Spirillospora sp. NPDC047279]|uniref:Rid family hydrolase n=1 Tax=Spirillospora sp. NPDC047279 TaxID=3155478 RepID=UPI00340EC538
MASDDIRTVRLPAVPGSITSAHAGAARVLGEHSLGPPDVVHVVEYATAAALDSYARVERARAAALGEHRVPVTTVPVEALLDPGAELAVELTAFPGGGRAAGELRIAEDVVYLPGVRPHGGGDFRAQYRECLENAARLLGPAGLGLESLVRTTDYTATATRADYPRCGRPRRDLLPGPGPGAAGILVDRPVAPGVMVSLDALASTAPLRAVNPGWRRYATLTYKPGVVAGRTLHMSGFGALEPATQKAIFAGDLAAQAEYVYASIAAVLREAGLGEELPYGCVTRLVEYITPDAAGRYEEVAGIRARYFGDVPALTPVVCSALLRPEFLIEVVPTAVLP